ncbi:hypothetical protein [Actinomyces wuliandei]|uniref:hypothetical protein n=1 Tax=Actinomyces wuliandei TaxID=2057743 RepID=UPI000FD92A5C|nr:hypothetical protein [Actinomyces wuliandei]
MSQSTPPPFPAPDSMPPHATHPPSPAASHPRRRRRLWLPVALVAVLVLGLAAAGGIYVATRTPSVPAADAQADQCIQSPSQEEPVVVDCDSDDAVYRVVANIAAERRDNPKRSCASTPGTEAVYEDLCLIGRNDDPEESLSTVKDGDCLAVDDIDAESPEAAKAACTTGTYPVLAVIHNVNQPVMGGLGVSECQEAAADTAHTYGWSFTHYTHWGVSAGRYDFVFCLGEPQG